jgi:hypothetical protein
MILDIRGLDLFEFFCWVDKSSSNSPEQDFKSDQ